ncbi:MAG: hypothetical protein JST19_04310 [Bacteroidetes bacterium]|nr:hypothetical protein [Bacteroidota bacterium]
MFAGCANLEKINDFASNAENGAAGFETLPVTFQSLCADNCREKDIDSGKLNPSKCDCTGEHLADSVDFLFYKTINGYLAGLEQLSAGKATSYNFDSLNDQLTNLKVPPAQAGAYTKLGSILTKAITDGYRRNKLKTYIKEANEPLQILLHYLRSNIGTSLMIKLSVNKSKLENDYLDLLKNSRGNDFEKRKIIEEFYAKEADFENRLAELKAYSALLQTIAQGHQQLTDNVDKPDKKSLETMLSQYASNIKDIRSQIQILEK